MNIVATIICVMLLVVVCFFLCIGYVIDKHIEESK